MWAKNRKKRFTEERTRMYNRCMKKILLVMRETQLKIT